MCVTEISFHYVRRNKVHFREYKIPEGIVLSSEKEGIPARERFRGVRPPNSTGGNRARPTEVFPSCRQGLPGASNDARERKDEPWLWLRHLLRHLNGEDGRHNVEQRTLQGPLPDNRELLE